MKLSQSLLAETQDAISTNPNQMPRVRILAQRMLRHALAYSHKWRTSLGEAFEAALANPQNWQGFHDLL